MRKLFTFFLIAVISTAGARVLREDTATQVAIGPFIDGTDFITPETGLTVTAWDCGIVKHADSGMSATSITITASGGSNDAAHLDNGIYSLELTATDTSTAGRLTLVCDHATPSTFLVVTEEWVVMPTQEYDSLYGTDVLAVDVTQIGGVAQSATDLKDFADAGYNPTTNYITGITGTNNTLDDIADASGHVTPADDSITASKYDQSTAHPVALADSGANALARVGADGDTLETLSDQIDGTSTLTQAQVTGGAYALDTDANGRIRVVDGTGTGEINTASGVVQAQLASNVTHGGGTTTRLVINNSAGTEDAVVFSGGTGAGVSGLSLSAASSSGYGLFAEGQGGGGYFGGEAASNAFGLRVQGDGTEDGLVIAAGATGNYIDINGTEMADGTSLTEAGGTGDQLSAQPWNSAWDTEVQSEVTDGLNAYDPPTNAEMEARTLAAASYFDPAADAVANVTLTATTTNLTNLPAAAATATELAKVPKSDGTATWNATALASIEAEATDAIEADGLQYLVNTALPTNWATDITANSALDYLADDGTAVFDRTTDSQQAIADSGGGGPTAAQIVDEWETQSQADPTGFHVNVLEVNGTAQTANDNGADINAILVDTGTTLDGKIDTIDTNVDAVLVDTGTTLDGKLDDIQGATFSTGTDSLEAIRDRGDAAWTTGSGTGLTAIASGTAQGVTGTTIQLAAGETFADDEIIGAVVHVDSASTGAGQTRCITDYAGSTDTATVATWTTTPTGTITYEVVPSLGGDCPMSAADVEGEVTDALEADGLDHLVAASVTGTDVADDSIIANMAGDDATADWDTFDNTTESLEALRNRGDAAWTTGSGTGLSAIASGTAQAGTGTTIQLAAGETFGDDILNYNVVKLTGGTGDGQARLITDYTGATDTATILPAWTTNPDATTTYEVVEGAAFLASLDEDDTAIDINATATGAAASVTGAVGSVTGAVGSVTGNVGGNVVGSVGSVTGHTAQTGDSFARLGAPAGASVSADIAAVPTAAENRTEMDSNSTQLAAIVADTNELQTDDIPGQIAALNDLSTTDIQGITIEGSFDLRDVLATVFARQVGTVSKTGDTWTVKTPDGVTTRVTFDTSGTTRSSVTVTPP